MNSFSVSCNQCLAAITVIDEDRVQARSNVNGQSHEFELEFMRDVLSPSIARLENVFQKFAPTCTARKGLDDYEAANNIIRTFGAADADSRAFSFMLDRVKFLLLRALLFSTAGNPAEGHFADLLDACNAVCQRLLCSFCETAGVIFGRPGELGYEPDKPDRASPVCACCRIPLFRKLV